MAPHALKKRRLNPLDPLDAHDGDNTDHLLSDESSTGGGQEIIEEQADGPETGKRSRMLEKSAGKTHGSPMPVPSVPGGYGSSILKLQIDELLTRLRKDYEKRATGVDNALRKLKTVIEHIPSQEATPVLEAERELQNTSGIRVPFPEPRPGKETKYLLAYAKPADINVVGSHARKTAIRAEDGTSVDLAVTMPSTIFQDKDYLNYRYFHKRAYYLACLASGIQAAKDFDCSMSYAYQNDNPLQPIIIINPSSIAGQVDINKSKFQIRIVLAASEDLFPIAKTLPGKNCVRLPKSENPAINETGLPTPFYNASLRSECCTLSSLKLLHAASTQVEAFGDACRLGSVWLHQRGMGTGLKSGGFGQFEWASLLAILLQGGGMSGKPVLSKGSSSLQLFKATLQFLAARDLVTNRLVLRGADLGVDDSPGPILFDGQQGINILFKSTAWSYRMLRHEARTTLQTLSTPFVDQFGSTFISMVDMPLQRFDSILRLCIPRAWRPSKEAEAADRNQAFCRHVCDVLSIGLDDRISLIYSWYTTQSTWSTNCPAPRKDRHNAVSVGYLLRSDQAFRTVDHGPPTEDKAEAPAFRQFWGEKAELRRFRDGSMLETLIWAQDSGSSIIEQITRYILHRHLGPEAVKGLGIIENLFNSFISDPGPPNASPAIANAFETLEKDIRGMEGLPLQVRQVSAASAQLRYASLTCSPNAPLSQRSKNTPPADICVQFEGSARWPNDIAAVQRTKIAFLLKIGELLESGNESLTARVGQENEKHKLFNSAFLDIVYPNGATFRLRIHHERERSILETALKDKTTEVGKREEIASAIAAYKRTFVQAPLHTQAVRSLCTRYPLLSPSMRLMKRWRDSHLLSGHISDELIELFTIRTFVTPYPYQAPGSLMTAFLRTLTYISKWDWHVDPLIVDFNGVMTIKDVDGIRLRFEAWRKIDPAMNRIAMFAASNLDPDGITWTEQDPSKVVAARFTGLARAACNLVKEQALQIRAASLFVPSMAEYDFVIHLNVRFTEGNQGLETKKPAFKNLQLENTEATSLVGYDPVKLYIEELRSLYGSNVLFFHDEMGGSAIAGLWNPQTGPRAWKVNIPYSTIPLMEDGEEKISINKAATLNDIARLGADMISRIELR